MGPIGAINNGSEFFRDEFPETKSQAIDLIESSGKEAVARVQFYRQAYGALPEGNADTEEMKELVQNFFITTKVTLQWNVENNLEISNLQKKLLLNILILASGSLIRGGVINITLGSNELKLSATGDRAAFNEKLAEILKNGKGKDALDAKTIQAFYTYQVAMENNAKIKIDNVYDVINFIITK